MRVAVAMDMEVERDAAIPTWFGVGGGAERLARPASVEDVRRCVEMDASLRVLGDGANLLVDDDGVPELVVALTRPEMRAVSRDPETGLTVAMGGASLPKMVTEAVRLGLAGLEGLGGIPATIGGAVMMNAGGAFGQIADVVARVHGVDRRGAVVSLSRSEIGFSYRHSGLQGMIITKVELDLKPGDPEALRAKLKDVMAYKKNSQPMAEKSAGCCFKNPTLKADAEGVGTAGARVGAGMLIDRAGCKGLRVGGAEVSDWHANFVVTREGARARDVIELMALVQRRVMDRFGVAIEPEVVVWSRGRE
jgi:UDP-N-acetylmuramate dehydrogenase